MNGSNLHAPTNKVIMAQHMLHHVAGATTANNVAYLVRDSAINAINTHPVTDSVTAVMASSTEKRQELLGR